MRIKCIVSAVTACSLLALLGSAPVAATEAEQVCIPFQHKYEGELPSVSNPFGLQCSVAAKAHVDPRDACNSFICVSLHGANLLPEVGQALEIEVLSICNGGSVDGTGGPSGGPAIASAETPSETSVCLGGAALGFYGDKEGKIKINCFDGNTKTKSDYEYHCSRLPS